MFISRLVIEGKDDGVEAINSNFDSYGSDVTFDGFSLVYEGDADDAYWSLPSQFLGNIVRKIRSSSKHILATNSITNL